MKSLLYLAIVLCAASVLLTLPAHAGPITFTGPISAYYLDNFSDHRIYVVQGTTVINSFDDAYGALVGGSGTYQEAMIAVTDTVRTNAFPQDNGPGGIGGQYTLAGVPTLVQYGQPTSPTITNTAYDATSDGTFNYYLQFQGTWAWRV